jgi:hypothetical protein
VTTLLLAAAGMVVAMRRRARFQRLWLVVFCAAGYYLTAIVPVGFIYDRFQLGWMAPVGLLAAIGFDALWRSARRFETIRRAVAAVVLIGAVVPAVLIDTEMVNGSRQRIERWLDARVADDPFVVAVANPLYLPRLSAFRHRVLNMVEDNLPAWKGDLVVLNEEWVHRVPFPAGHVEALLQRGSYTEVYRDMAGARPWWSQAFTSAVPDNGTNLLKISPSFSVWQIARPAAGLGPS